MIIKNYDDRHICMGESNVNTIRLIDPRMFAYAFIGYAPE